MEYQSINNILVAIASGIIPALVWLWFWLKEDDKRPEPKGLLFLAFLGGMIAVPLVLPIQEFLSSISIDDKTFVGLAAASEEILKFLMFIIIILPSGKADEPIDFPIYFITIALGFSALENSMFLFDPITTQDTTVSLLTGGLRFLGASILHTISSAAIGIGMGLGFRYLKIVRAFYSIVGIMVAILLHGTFNFLIINDTGEQFWRLYGVLWVLAIVSMLFFERLRRISDAIYYKENIQPTIN